MNVLPSWHNTRFSLPWVNFTAQRLPIITRHFIPSDKTTRKTVKNDIYHEATFIRKSFPQLFNMYFLNLTNVIEA